MGIYISGESVQISVIFTNTASVTGDPTTVYFSWRDSVGGTGQYVYGSATAIARDGTGQYSIITAVGNAGTFRYRWESEGNLPGASESWFTVKRSRV